MIYKEENGQKLEPMETLVVSVEDGLSGTVIDMLAPRKGLMQNMSSENGLTTMEFIIQPEDFSDSVENLALRRRANELCIQLFLTMNHLNEKS